MFSSWTPVPLNKELLAISNLAASQRRPAVEGQYDTIQIAVVEHLRKLARQHPENLNPSFRFDEIFAFDLYAPKDTILFTPTGLAFKNAMAGIEPPYPTSKEKNWLCSRISGYLESQGLSVKYEYETLTVSWIPAIDEV